MSCFLLRLSRFFILFTLSMPQYCAREITSLHCSNGAFYEDKMCTVECARPRTLKLRDPLTHTVCPGSSKLS